MTEARKQHYRTFARELADLCKKFEADNLQASIMNGMIVVQFGPEGEVIAYDRTGELTVMAIDGSAWMNQQLAPRNVVRNADGQIIGQNWDASYGGLSEGDTIEAV